MTRPEDAVLERERGVILCIEVSPGSDSDTFPDGYNEWRNALGCRTRAKPREGQANKAVIRIIAGRLGVPATSVSVVSGVTSSQKKVFITGITRDDVIRRLFFSA